MVVGLTAGVAGAFALLYLVNAALLPLWIAAVPLIVFPIVTAGKLIRTAASSAGGERSAWLCFGLGCLSYAAAETHWTMHELRGLEPFWLLDGLGYAVLSLLFVVGLWRYRVGARPVGDPVSQMGNLGVIVGAAMLAYLFQYSELMRTTSDPIYILGVIAGGAANGAALIFGLAIFLLHAWGPRRIVTVMLLSGFAVIALMDATYAYSLLYGSYRATDLINGFYLVGFALLYLAAVEQRHLADGNDVVAEPPPVDRSTQWSTLIAPFAAGFVVLCAVAFRTELSPELLWLGLGPATLLVVSLGIRNWWGHKAQLELRLESHAVQRQLEEANRELRDEIETRSRVEAELRQSQKLEAVGQLTGGVAHDFNNLLSVIISGIEIAESRAANDPVLSESLGDASAAATHAASLTQRLLSLSRKQAFEAESLATADLLEDMRALLERTLGERIRVSIACERGLRSCLADRSQLESAILNLAINARDAMPDGGELVIRGTNVDVDEEGAHAHPESSPGPYVAISVRDTGCGIPDEVRSHVLEPFFTTKEAGAGTGLGLSMVHGFAVQSGGQLTIESERGRGTEVCLRVPASKAAVERVAPPRRIEGAPEGRGERILVVEDEPAVRKLVVSLLGNLGYEATAVSNGAEAITCLEELPSPDLLLSDIVLPGRYSGADLAVEIGRHSPDTRVLYMSGYAPEAVLAECSMASSTELLRKPFRRAELARAVRSALEA